MEKEVSRKGNLVNTVVGGLVIDDIFYLTDLLKDLKKSYSFHKKVYGEKLSEMYKKKSMQSIDLIQKVLDNEYKNSLYQIFPEDYTKDQVIYENYLFVRVPEQKKMLILSKDLKDIACERFINGYETIIQIDLDENVDLEGENNEG